MLSSSLVRATRVLLHDTSEGYSTDNSWWQPEEVNAALTTARMETYRLLIMRPEPAYVTCARLIKTATVTSGGAVPTDFYLAICGYKTDGTYVPYEKLSVGQAYRDATTMDQLFISGQVIYGTMNTLVYWAKPTIAITEAATTLSDFPDGFYNAVKYDAALALLMKEDASAVDRWGFCQAEFKRKVLTLG